MKLGKEPNYQRLRYIVDTISFSHLLGYVVSEDFTSEFTDYLNFCIYIENFNDKNS